MEPVDSEGTDASVGRMLGWAFRAVLYPLAIVLIVLAWHQRSAARSDDHEAPVAAVAPVPTARPAPVQSVPTTPGPTAPTTTRAAVSGRGCDRFSDDEVIAVARRTVAPPAQRIAFFAPRVGSLPRDGTATVGDVALPAGSRCPHYWATDAPTADAIALARRLAREFPRTGLWPVLWDWEESPDHYASSSGDPRRADGIDVRAALGLSGLAAGSVLPAGAPDPFAQLAASGYLESSVGQVLLLVPVHRPADAIAMLGFIQSEVVSDPALTGVARSWEERVGAFLTTMGPGTLGLSVSAPPTTPNQARALAAEQWALSSAGDENLEALAATLPQRGFWDFGWPD